MGGGRQAVVVAAGRVPLDINDFFFFGSTIALNLQKMSDYMLLVHF